MNDTKKGMTRFTGSFPKLKPAMILYSLTILLAMAGVTCLTACGGKKTEAAIDESTTVAVQLANVETVSQEEPVSVSGLISGKNESKLSFKTGGIIQKILVREGENVQAGQLLASLNLTEIGAMTGQAEEAVAKAERDLQRAEALFKDSVVSKEQLDNARTGYTIAKQNADIAGFNKNYSEIRAPFAGTVLFKLMNEGELAGSGYPVLVLSSGNSTQWIFKAGLTDKFWSRLKVGNSAEIRSDLAADSPVKAKVTSLSAGADPYTGLYQVELSLEPTSVRLASGLFARAVIQAGSANFKSVPIDALVEGNLNEAFVFHVQEGKAHRIPVKVAWLTDSKAIISSGLDGVNQVVKAGSAFLTDQSPVLVKP